ncbi:MAG: glycosyltransferase family protein [archaeon]
MKYLFLTTGIALGHCTRDEALIRFLEKDNDVTIACYNISYNYFKDRYDTIKLASVGFSNNDQEFKLIKNLIINWSLFLKWFYNLIKLKIYVMKNKPDLIISDFEPIGLFFKKSIFIFNYSPEKIKGLDLNTSLKFQKTLLNFQFKLLKLFRKTIIVPCINKESINKEITNRDNTNKDNAEFIRPVDLIIRRDKEELGSKEALMKKLNLKKEPILIMLGGSKFGLQLVEKIINVVEDFDEQFVIFGYEIEKENITGFKFKENFLEYLKVCKGVITLAGFSTLSEALLYKKPCLVFPIENHIEQLSVINEFEPYIIHKRLDCTEEHIYYHIKNFLKNKIKLENKIKNLNINNSTKEVVGILISEAEKNLGE